MNDFHETVLESFEIQLEQIGLCDMIQDLSDIFKSKTYKIILLRKLLLLITSDNRIENETDEELLDIADNFGFCTPENFLNVETGSLQNQVKFWNRIFKCIDYLGRCGVIKETVPNTWVSTKNDSSYKLEEIANIFEKMPEESTLGCAELDSDKPDLDYHFEGLNNSELEIKDLITDADEALNYLTPLSKHTHRFVDNMQDLTYHSDSHSIDNESGPSIINDPTLLKTIELLHHQVNTFDEIMASFDSNIQVAETKHLKEDQTNSIQPAFLNDCQKILDDLVVCRNF